MRHVVLAVFAAGLFVSCESDAPYEPASKPEQIQFKRVRLDVYPEDVRKDLAHYTNTPVAWVGVIRGTKAEEDDFGGKISADSSFDHHYFDWEHDTDAAGVNLLVSPRGEGTFSCHWQLQKKDNEASAYDAEKFAHAGNLAIVYGVPESVKDDGTVVLRYCYLRVLGPGHFNTNELNYGRLGLEPYRPMVGQ